MKEHHRTQILQATSTHSDRSKRRIWAQPGMYRFEVPRVAQPQQELSGELLQLGCGPGRATGIRTTSAVLSTTAFTTRHCGTANPATCIGSRGDLQGQPVCQLASLANHSECRCHEVLRTTRIAPLAV